MKKYKITFWIIAWIIFLLEGVMPALTSQTDMALQGITHLGYPIYFSGLLALFKVLGSIALVVPAVKGNFKEWVFAGFGFDFLFALMSLCIVDGFTPVALFPLVMFLLLAVAYVSYHKMNAEHK